MQEDFEPISLLELIILQFISPSSLIEQIRTYDADRKYLRYAGDSNDEEFPDVELNIDTAMTSETS